MISNLQTGSREKFSSEKFVSIERGNDREYTQKALGNCIHIRGFELIQLVVLLEGLNTPQILKYPEIFREVSRQINSSLHMDLKGQL
jgi:hypothetical protein